MFTVVFVVFNSAVGTNSVQTLGKLVHNVSGPHSLTILMEKFVLKTIYEYIYIGFVFTDTGF